MPRYITLDDIKPRLIGKIRFTTDASDENKMQESLAERLISDAESQVEFDLSPRYQTPFVGVNEEAFADLPEHPTRYFLRNLIEIKSIIYLLNDDFGYGTTVDAENYTKNLSARYAKMVNKVLAHKKDGQGWKYPPLTDLKLNYFNTEADDGYHGQVLVTSDSTGDFASKRVNDPSRGWWYGL